jgi:hypothetical protein
MSRRPRVPSSTSNQDVQVIDSVRVDLSALHDNHDTCFYKCDHGRRRPKMHTLESGIRSTILAKTGVYVPPKAVFCSNHFNNQGVFNDEEL